MLVLNVCCCCCCFLMQPCVCTRDLCVFAFQTLGVMADAAESIAADASVRDLVN